jgi:exodeoxyribonuclease VII large subunit
MIENKSISPIFTQSHHPKSLAKGVPQIMREADSMQDSPWPGGADFSAPAVLGIAAKVWGVGALCRAIADALDARFNPVTVRGEITGFSRAASGHCYFSLKDASGQIRCAMFRRAATLLSFAPRDGALVEVRGKLGVYEQRGDLQLIVESMQPAGQGALFEQFLRLKAQLESEGLFDPARKRPVPIAPRGIGLVTSLGAAALHDVASALQRRVPHIPVTLVSASVQGAQAPAELCQALSKLYLLEQQRRGLQGDLADKTPPIDVILLVRGGGSLEDLWAFNDERLARLIAASPVPIISGVGHETDFTIADFVADLRAPTPTAAAELCSVDRATWLGAARLMQTRLQSAAYSALDQHTQRLDIAASRLGRPSDALQQQHLDLQRLQYSLQRYTLSKTQLLEQKIRGLQRDLTIKTQEALRKNTDKLTHAQRSLDLLNPQRILERGYAVLQDSAGHVVGSAKAVQTGQKVKATLADGSVQLTAD